MPTSTDMRLKNWKASLPRSDRPIPPRSTIQMAVPNGKGRGSNTCQMYSSTNPKCLYSKTEQSVPFSNPNRSLLRQQPEGLNSGML